MKVPYSWLREFLDPLPPVDELAELCDGLGLATEQVYRYPGAAPGTVAVRIETLEPVSGSDHLLTAQVFDGSKRHQVVTGAPNARVGLITAFAAPGVELAALAAVEGRTADNRTADNRTADSRTADNRTVESRPVAGVDSNGVLLSPRELGVFDHAGGLIELPEEVQPGSDLAELWPGDDILELELTPNRADAFSILGVARDVAAKLAVPYRHPAADSAGGDAEVDDGLSVQIADSEGCTAITLRRIDSVKVRPSPVWLQRRLASVGLRPRNNIVDVTNFVTFELGQPSHAYDLAALQGGVVQVRRAREGERLTALTGDELELGRTDLVIATPDGAGSKAIGLAGVVGGSDDSVESGTESVALETAHFDRVSIRRTARRHGLSTDAHYRFERGVDPLLPPLASARAADLIARLSGGRVHPGVSVADRTEPPLPVAFRPSRVEFLMDFEVALADQRRYLEALGCRVEAKEQDHWSVTPPSWRFDLAIEEDLVEEVARLHGYEHVGETVPVMHFVPPPSDPTHRALRQEIAGLGFREAIGYVFTSPGELERAAAPEPVVRLSEPQGVERSVLRTALYPGLLAAAQLNRATPSLALFEVGRVFLEEELERVALLASGPWIEPGWQGGRELDFFQFKGLLELLAGLRNAKLETRPVQLPHLHPGISAEVSWNGRSLGSCGRLHPEVAARYELGDVYIAELDLPLAARPVRFTALSRQPHAERDVSVVAPKDVSYREIRELVDGAGGALLETVEPFDVYEGAPIAEGERSLALRLRFRHDERALEGDEVDGYMENVIRSLRERGYDIRDR